MVPVMAESSRADVIKVENSAGVSDKVEVYYNRDNNEYSAVFDMKDFQVGETIVVYENPETGESVGIDFIANDASALPFAGNTGWSGGRVPNGTSTMRPYHKDKSIEVSYYETLTAYPPKFIDVYNPSLECYIGTVSLNSLRIVTATAGAASAKTSMEFTIVYTALGVTSGTMVTYLTHEIDKNGYSRISWGW